jgi:hypothetical protein
MPDNPLSGSRPRPSGAGAPGPSPRHPTLGSRPAFWPTAMLVGASFLLLFEFLAYQLRNGNDPALGGQTASALPPRPVLVRRVIKTRVVEDPSASSSGQVTVSSGGGSSSVSTTSVAPAAAPAPAPAAPVVSSSS